MPSRAATLALGPAKVTTGQGLWSFIVVTPSPSGFQGPLPRAVVVPGLKTFPGRPMTIHEVLALARQRLKSKSDRAFARDLGMVFSGYQRIAKSQGLPSDAAMVRISRAAGIAPEEGLLMLNMWRSDGEIRSAYGRILKKISTRNNGAIAA